MMNVVFVLSAKKGVFWRYRAKMRHFRSLCSCVQELLPSTRIVSLTNRLYHLECHAQLGRQVAFTPS